MSSLPPNPATEPGAQPRSDLIARRIATGFGLIAMIAVAMCAMLFGVISHVAGLVSDMRSKELAINESHALATAVREQYTHQAHTLIEGNASHMPHYQAWVERVEQTVTKLRPIVPRSEVVRLSRVQQASERLDQLFRQQMIPAAERGDRETVARVHHEADHLSQSAAREADAIVNAVQSHMVHDHVSATYATRVGFAMSALCVLAIVSLSSWFTLRLRHAVLRPLAVIAQSARRIGRGDLSVRLGAIGEGELRAVAEAFDRMVEEVKERERRLLEAERMAAIGQLAAGVAHEINNPIGIIRGYLKTMTVDSPPDVLRDELRILDDEAAACQRIAEDLLTYARSPDLRANPLDVDALMREAVRRFEETQRTVAGRFVVRAEPGTIVADGGRLRQVVLNLLRNAVQASPSGATIDVTGASRPDGGYEIAVADTGPGVDPKDRTMVFEPFFSKRADGSGLGLAVCQGIVRAHGGVISVAERPGGGAVFCVRLPAAARPPSETTT